MTAVVDLIPHRAPWLLVDRVVERGRGRVRAEKRLSAGDPLLAEGLPELLLVEALAQTAACVMGEGAKSHRGLLVAASTFEFHGRGQAGETVTLSAEKRAALGTLHRFVVAASVGDRLLARGEMTFAVEIAPPSAAS